MKISTLVSAALLAVAPIAHAFPAANIPGEDHISDAAKFLPIDERDLDNGPILRGAGYLQEQHLKRRNVNTQRVTGVRVGYSGAYRVYRQEIRKFYNDQGGLVYDLFLLALRRMYTLGASDVNSYWQLAGIHGRPFQGWADDSSSTFNRNGYCTHGSTLFPTWHRPYLAYIEEVIWANAEWIINNQVRTQDREKWRGALMVLRLPYYDWAANANFPIMFTQQNYQFRFWPSGTPPGPQPNPLYSGKFNQGTYNGVGNFGGAPWTVWPETKRAPEDGQTNNPGAPSRNNVVNDGLVANANSLRQRTLNLLLNNNRWNTFSNRAGGGSDSLESIHDTIHGLVGRNGHMSYVEYSSFDPVFFLHHCNVDRLFAMWQAINPTTYVTSQVNRGGTYGVAPGSVEYRTSPLRPFKGLSNQYYNSDSARDTSLFGYGYYETPKWKYDKSTETQYANVVRRTVQNLYGNTALTSAAMRKRDLGNATEAGIDASINNNKYTEWRINVIADKSEGNGTYFLHFFLGKPSRNPEEWYSQKELVGDYVVFTHDHQAAPGIDPASIDNTVTGTVPLTDAMLKAFGDTELNSLKPVDATTFLIKNLRWRATNNAGEKIPIRKLKGLKVSVSTNLASLPTDERPWTEFGEWKILTEIARRIGREGGPDRVNIIPNLSSSAVPSSTAAPATTSAPAAEEATTTSEASVETTSSEAAAPTETSE